MKRILLILPVLAFFSCSSLIDDYEICVRNSSGATITCEINGTTYTVGNESFSNFESLTVDADESLTLTINGTETFDLGAEQPKRFIISVFRTGLYFDYVIDEPIDAHVTMMVDGTTLRYDGATLLSEDSGKYTTRFYQNTDDTFNNLVEITIPGTPQTNMIYNYTLCQSGFFSYILSHSVNEYTVANDSDFALNFTSIDSIRGTYTATFSGTLSQTNKAPIAVTNGYISGYFGK